jgi:hypothetical protein
MRLFNFVRKERLVNLLTRVITPMEVKLLSILLVDLPARVIPWVLLVWPNALNLTGN